MGREEALHVVVEGRRRFGVERSQRRFSLEDERECGGNCWAKDCFGLGAFGEEMIGVMSVESNLYQIGSALCVIQGQPVFDEEIKI